MSRVTRYRFTLPLFLTLGTVRLEVDVMIDSNILKFVDLIRILCSQFYTHIDWKDVFLTCPKLAFCNVLGKSSHAVNSVDSAFLSRYLFVFVFPEALIFLLTCVYYEQRRVERSCLTRQIFDSDADFCDSRLCISGSVNRVGIVVPSVSVIFQCFRLPFFKSLTDSSFFKCAR